MVLFVVLLYMLEVVGLLVDLYWKIYLLVMGVLFVFMVLVIIVVEKCGKMKIVLLLVVVLVMVV